MSVSPKSRSHVTHTSESTKEVTMPVSRKSHSHVTHKSESTTEEVTMPVSTANRSLAHTSPTTVVPEPETTSSPAAAPATPASPPALTALVASVIQSLDTLESSLDLNIVVRQNDKAQMHAMNRVSPAALALASDIVASDPARFPDFSGLKDSASYVATMTPLANRVSDFASHLQNSILNQQAPAAQQTLILYTMVKGLARMDVNQSLRDKIGELKEEIVPKRKDPKPKQTAGQKSAKVSAKRLADRIVKAREFLATNDPGSLASPIVTTPAAPAVASPAPKAVVATGSATPTTSAPAPVTPVASSAN